MNILASNAQTPDATVNTPRVQSHNLPNTIVHGPGPKVLASVETLAAAGANFAQPQPSSHIDGYA
ncbi:MAG: hypothetical protein LIP23_03820 [Planctomycetes bacterium]|nr:hypothetical protein [Planctomycetota bacterium]